jgi:hypothetical protein
MAMNLMKMGRFSKYEDIKYKHKDRQRHFGSNTATVFKVLQVNSQRDKLPIKSSHQGRK